MKIGDPNAPWFPDQWGPETSDTRRCEHGKLGDDFCPECDDEPEWLNPPCLGCGSRGCDNPNCGDLESQE
jgi:hypothetical protein